MCRWWLQRPQKKYPWTGRPGRARRGDQGDREGGEERHTRHGFISSSSSPRSSSPWQQLADMLDGDGEVHAFGLRRRADHDADDRTIFVEQRAAGVTGIDGGLSLNRGGAPRDPVLILPLVVRSNLGHDALAEGPEVGLGMTDREHFLADVGHQAGQRNHRGGLRHELGELDVGEVPSLVSLEYPGEEEVAL